MRKREETQLSSEQQSQSEFKPNAWYESLLRMKRDHSRLYQRSISAATQRALEIYAEQKARAGKKAAQIVP